MAKLGVEVVVEVISMVVMRVRAVIVTMVVV